MTEGGYRVGVDIGGTFTDTVIQAPGGARAIGKAPTVAGRLDDGVLDSLSVSAQRLGIGLDELLAGTDVFVHGTTQGTNAVLSRSGAVTGLITTKGHEDHLIIGRVYAKMAGLSERELVRASRLAKPEPVVPRALTVGLTERIDCDGDVVVPIDDAEVAAAVRRLVEQGVQAIAVSLLWSFANPLHERRVAEIVGELGVDVLTVLSHEVAPVLGEYERTATTALSAYIGPSLVAYLERLDARLRGHGLRVPVLVMQANGGLTSVADAARRPLLTLDSGPSGGILGSQRLAERYGETDVVCTDVGGTSFDVGVVAGGRIPLDESPTIGQFTLRMPKILVRSIGAGGGSIVWVDDGGLLRVGPRSAGANPGPACYGRGGLHATVTDADVVLGIVDGDRFLGGRMPLDRDLAIAALDRVGAPLGMSAQDVALGVFRIVNAQMADLIRKATIEQGHDPRRSVLAAYGGAGPSHAVFYGSAIGAKRILVPAESTVFSAAGMLTCDLVRSMEASHRVRSPLSSRDMAAIRDRFAGLEERLRGEFVADAARPQELGVAWTIGVRFRAQVQSLMIDVTEDDLRDDGEHLTARFFERYQATFGAGGLLEGGELEIDHLRVTVTRALDHPPSAVAPVGGRDAAHALRTERDICVGPEGLRRARVYDGDRLAPGNAVDGPAVIERMGDCLVVPDGWRAELDGHRTLVVAQSPSRPGAREASTGSPARPAQDAIDPVTFEIVRHRLWAINDDQARMAAGLSGSFIVYDGYDFNSALVTPDGRGLCCGVYILHHGATIDYFVRRILDDWAPEDIREGDMFFTNDPWWGALHANDGIVAMPVFHDGRIIAWSGIVMHDNDVGGPVPGSFVAGAPDRFGEAPLLPAVKLVESFEPRADLERLYLRNSRTPELNALNMRARVAALRLAHERIVDLADEYGADTLLAVQDGIVDYVARTVRARMDDIPDGTWSATGYLDHDSVTAAVYPIRCSVTKAGGVLTVDFDGTSAQAPGPINCTLPALEGMVLGVVLASLCQDLPWATGGLRGLVDLVARPGSLVNARSPAAVSMASITGLLSAQDVATHAFAQMLLASERFRAEATATWTPGIADGLLVAQRPGADPALGGVVDCFGGGGGARTDRDGIDSGGIFHSMASRIANAEVVESEIPVLQLWRRELRDGGGAGRYRGGVPIEFAAIAHKLDGGEAGLSNVCSGVSVPAGRGLAGGHPGAPARSAILRGSDVHAQLAAGRLPTTIDAVGCAAVELPEAKSYVAVGADDLIVGSPAGGGGYGDPLRRDVADVVADVRAGYVSVAGAASMYGVVVVDGVADHAGTTALRDATRRVRLDGAATAPIAGARGGGASHPQPTRDAIVTAPDGTPRCGACGASLGTVDAGRVRDLAVRDVSLADLGPLNDRCGAAFVAREYSCPSCATCVALEVRRPAD